MTANRPHGIIKDFCIASDGYLALIVRDLGLDVPLPIMQFLQSVYTKERRTPTVDELIFDLDYMRSRAPGHCEPLIGEFDAEDPAIPPLFSRLVSEKYASAETHPLGVSLSRLFFRICEPDAEPESGTFSLISTRQPRFPQAFGTQILGESGGFLLGYSSGKTAPRTPDANYGVLILPREGQTAAAFVRDTQRMLRNVHTRIPEAYVYPCTGDGLLSDALTLAADVLLFPGCIPGAENVPESVIPSRAPGFLLFVPQSSTEYVRDYARFCGFPADVPVILRDGKDSIQVFSSGDPLRTADAHLRALTAPAAYHLRVQAGPAAAAEPLVFSGEGTAIAAYSLHGTVYDALRSICRPDCAYAFALRFNPWASDTVPLLLSLDAFLRGSAVPIAAACTEPAEQTELIVFRIPASAEVPVPPADSLSSHTDIPSPEDSHENV